MFKVLVKACVFSVFCCAAHAAQADGKPATILILDASNSMWGQIDGVNKIVIAKDVVEELILGLPDNQPLGLVAYGHRRKGDCSDIETLSDVGTKDNRQKLIKGVRSLSPKGRTPISASLEHSAKALNYTKNAASVILVSDGLETCDADPCALSRLLEEKGLDFTIHVVGFDVTRKERAGLQCIAEETGGLFLPADNAEDLASALSQVAMTEPAEVPVGEPAPTPQKVALKATILRNGPDIQSKLDWTISPAGSDKPVFTATDTGYSGTALPPGDYVARADWNGWRGGEVKSGETAFTVKPKQPKVVTVAVDLGLPLTLEGPDLVLEGEAIEVTWTGPDDLGAYISVNRLDDGPREFIYFTPAQKARDAFAARAKGIAGIDSNGDGAFTTADMATAAIGGPSKAGDYELRYTIGEPRVILARQPIMVKDGQQTITIPQSVAAGTPFTVEWSGHLTDGDFLTIVPAGSAQVFANAVAVRLKSGAPAQMTAPAEPGEYEVRYILANGYTLYEGMQSSIQASAPLQVTGVTATLSAPSQAVGGSTIEVTWDGPEGWENDQISIVKPGAKRLNRKSFAATARGGKPENPVKLRLPDTPGDYEVIYLMQPGNAVLVRDVITASPAAASVDAPDEIKAGESFSIAYTGEGFAGDRVVVVPIDQPDKKMWTITARYGFAAKPGGGTGTVSSYPTAAGPGVYEARYVTGVENLVIARDKITVVE